MADLQQHQPENKLSFNAVGTQLCVCYPFGWLPRGKQLFITALILAAGELVNTLFGLLLDYG